MRELLLPPVTRNPVEDLLDQLDLDSGERVGKRSGFIIMLILSGVIATAGVLLDSTATVIGAMIIAPLGTPILGIAVGIVTGRARLVLSSVLWVSGAVAAVILIGALFSLGVPNSANLNANSQIAGRTSPQLMDLVAALATGVAGAFAMSRKDLSAVLPGVAIAISLVPPLAVVGVTLGQGDFDGAVGAFLLFFSNVVALIIAGAIVFTLAGYARDALSQRSRRRRAYAIIAVLTVLTAIPLALNTVVILAQAAWTARIQAATTDWLGEGEVQGITWKNLRARVAVEAPGGRVPPLSQLRDALEPDLPTFVGVDVNVTDGVVQPVTKTD
ncbi:TIGR00341 family protein [Agromyces sp. SYSU T0242]|uniref:TIGR00341 family protein n=1 Tax=Agromyces litoreus TaxID=3158561 RepID=UPI0033944F42